MTVEIRTLTADETARMLENFNSGDRTHVLRRNAEKVSFEKPERPLTLDDFAKHE